MGDEPTPLGVLCKGGGLHERALAERVLDASIREGFLTACLVEADGGGRRLGQNITFTLSHLARFDQH